MFEVRYSSEAEDDLLRLIDPWFERIHTEVDYAVAATAVAAIREGIDDLSRHPFLYRKHGDDPLLRELLIPFGASGYVALYRILDASHVIVLGVRHQLEDDYH